MPIHDGTLAGMSAVSDQARVRVLLADYAAVDPSNKINALGVGWTISGITSTGVTAPQSIVVSIDVPATVIGHSFALGLMLVDADNTVVSLPGPDGAPQPLHITQTFTVDEPQFDPALNVPRHTVWGHMNLLMNFPIGLALPEGAYTWVAQIDGQTNYQWACAFYVPAHAPVDA